MGSIQSELLSLRRKEKTFAYLESNSSQDEYGCLDILVESTQKFDANNTEKK